MLATGDVMQLTTPTFAASVPTSPLLWLVNVCWPACGFCQALQAEWQLLARRLKHEAVVAYWDAARHPELPALLGQVNVTPTIRAVVPRPDGDAEGGFRLVDYHGTRRFEDLLRFARGLMPNYVHAVPSVERLDELEQQHPAALPRLLCFLGLHPEVPTPPLLRALSATYRGRVLVLEVRVHELAGRRSGGVLTRCCCVACRRRVAMRR